MGVKIVVRGVSVYYRSVKALEGVSLEVGEGEFMTLVGPNGAGKTTLLRCIDGILRPRLGVVLIDGRSVTAMDKLELARVVGYVPQEARPSLPFTVADVVMMGRRPYVGWRVSKEDLEAVKRAMDVVGITHLAGRYFDELSAGERQKVMIAKALAQEPDVLLLDEPTSNLDIRHQLEILTLIRRLAKEKGLTVVAAMHDLNLAYRFSDKVVMLSGGRVYAAGRPEDVLTPENIRRVYGVRVEVLRSPCPHIALMGVEEG